ncbi:MAG: hypothetical protein ABEI52_09145, partial [Halobacteriaceae archaeon]
MTSVGALFLIEVIVLILLSSIAIYPVFTHARRNVLHVHAIITLAAALFTFTLSSTIEYTLGWNLIGEVLHLVSTLLFLSGTWLLAR